MKYLITGANGLIGRNLVETLVKDTSNTVYAHVHSIEKGKEAFKELLDRVILIGGDIRSVEISATDLDYIIHGASITSSDLFVKQPLEVISVGVDGTRKILEIAKKQQNLKRLLYISSMEIYGTLTSDEKVSEDHYSVIDLCSARSSYIESKRMGECLCASYNCIYGIPYNVIRLSQTFGPGVRYNDKRIFAYFARCVIENKNIVLKTKGDTKRSYLYTGDAINAIQRIIYDGKPGETYNAANERTYCSIYEMAKGVAERVARNRIDVTISEEEIEKFGFAPTLCMNLDCTKLRRIGWEAKVDMDQMYISTINYMREQKQC